MFRRFKKEIIIGLLFLFFALAFNAVFLLPEITFSTPNLNDEVLHLITAEEAASALAQGHDPTDFWLPQIVLGFPLFHYYQHLPHLVLAVFSWLTGSLVSIAYLLDLSRYLLMVFYPLAIFLAMYRFGFGGLAAGIAALVSSLLSTDGLFGLDYVSYLWRGPGLYTQLWAMFFFPMALAEIYRVIKGRNSWFWPVFLSAIVLLSHLLYGVILFLSAAVIIFLRPGVKQVFSRLGRSIVIGVLVALVVSYFLIPFFSDSAYMNRSAWEESYKYDSLGALTVLKMLFTGNLFDFGRAPLPHPSFLYRVGVCGFEI